MSLTEFCITPFLHSLATLILLVSAAGDGFVASTTMLTAATSTIKGTSFTEDLGASANWSNLSPYRDAGSFGLPKGVPQDCELSQVHILHRHAQRYPTPTTLDGTGMAEFHTKLVDYATAHPNTTVGRGPLAFLNSWVYLMGEDTLLPLGAATEAKSGASNWDRYGRALYRAGQGIAAWNESLNVFLNHTARPKPVFRTTSQGRILESARWWSSGFFSNADANNSIDQYDLVIIPEGLHINNTLASDGSCPGDKTEGDKSAMRFISNYTKTAVSRLSHFLPADFNLTAFDVLAMQNICPYEFALLGNSSFCSLFTEQEWLDFEYQIDLQYYGDYGFGSPTGRAQGIGYVLELAARLEAKLIHSSDTSINYTFDNNPAQFPLHQPLYMDMSHDNVVVAVLTALGFTYFKYGNNSLPDNVPHAPNRTFHLNQITPFGARLVSEVWTCPAEVSFEELSPVLYQNPDLSTTPNTTDYLRFVLNNEPIPLDGLAGCGKGQNGFCAVKNFLGMVPQLHSKAEYQFACFANYTTGGQVVDGRPEVR